MPAPLLDYFEDPKADRPPYVIAELGANHCGNKKILADMVIEAGKAGASALKIQKRENKSLYTKEMYNSPYPGTDSFGETYGKHREALELDSLEINQLHDWAHYEDKMEMGATVFDITSLNYMEAYCPPDFYKIASGDLCNVPLHHAVAATGRPVVFSTGGAASIKPVYEAYERLRKGTPHVAIMHCTSAYPADYAKLNLRAIEELRTCFPEALIGWSSHARGINQAVAAYALGARIFEFHFTLDRYDKGTDQRFSLEPEGLGQMVRYLGYSAASLGKSERYRDDSEQAPLKKQWKNKDGLVDGEQTSGGYVSDTTPYLPQDYVDRIAVDW